MPVARLLLYVLSVVFERQSIWLKYSPRVFVRYDSYAIFDSSSKSYGCLLAIKDQLWKSCMVKSMIFQMFHKLLLLFFFTIICRIIGIRII